MSRSFSWPLVLRNIPRPLLRDCFKELNVFLPGVDWEADDAGVEPIVLAISRLSHAEFDQTEALFRSIFELASQRAAPVLFEADQDIGSGRWHEELPEQINHYHRAMLTWLHHRSVFEHASILSRLDSLSWWRRRDDLATLPPDYSRDALDGLKREIAKIFQEAQGRGRHVTLDPFERRNLCYLFAYVDNYVENVMAHDDIGVLHSHTHRQTFDVVFAFDRLAGSLELYARVPAKLKVQLENAFAKVCLSLDLGPWQPEASFHLDSLTSLRSVQFATDPEDGVRVVMKRLRLNYAGSQREIQLTGDPDIENDIEKMLETCFDRSVVPVESLRVSLATFLFEFEERPGRKAGHCSFDVVMPNTCSLRNQPPYRVELVNKYLRRWGILVGGAPFEVSAGVA